MNLLLDTHAYIWWVMEPERLKTKTQSLLTDASNIVYVSAISMFEIATKRALGKLHASDRIFTCYAEAGFSPLALTLKHAAAVGTLPSHHRDPFDRLLIAQAMLENLTVVTQDKHFPAYPISTIEA